MNTRYSFDVFDTTLVRTWAQPRDVFWEVGRYLQQSGLIADSPEVFMKKRYETELLLNQNTPGGSSFDAIYQQLSELYGWSKQETRMAQDMELSVEERALHPVATVQKKISEARSTGTPIVFFSDMYLPSAAIQRFLRKHNIWQEGDQLFISNEHKADKSSQGLYRHFLKTDQQKVDSWIHTGDHPIADIEAPQKLGAQTIRITDTQLNHYEQRIAHDEAIPYPLRGIIPGVSRLARLSSPASLAKTEKVLWDLGASLAGPILFGFVHWCLLKAKKDGIRRLYFLSRDGEILYKIAQRICKSRGYDIECRYLRSSRSVWYTAAGSNITSVDIDRILAYFANPTVRKVCERVRITPQEISPALISAGFTTEGWDQVLTDDQFASLKKLLVTGRVRSVLQPVWRKVRDRTLGYLLQEGLGDGIPWAIVDSGWSGTGLISLKNIISHAGARLARRPAGYYFALRGTPPGIYACDAEAFFSDSRLPQAHDALVSSHSRTALLEMIMSSAEKPFIDVAYANGIFKPAFQKQSRTEEQLGLIQLWQNAIEKFSDLLIAHSRDLQISHRTIVSLLEEFFDHPTGEEKRAFVSLPYATDPQEHNMQPFSSHNALRWSQPPEQITSTQLPRRMLNIGCGMRWHTDWVNLDIRSAHRDIIQHDALKGLPFPSNSFDIVYHSHLLEHLPRTDSAAFLQECLRVLRPGGIIRIAVPNFEQLAKNYLHTLAHARVGTEIDWRIHEWSILEIADQLVRTTSGGIIPEFMRRTNNKTVENLIMKRWGAIGRQLFNEAKLSRPTGPWKPFLKKMLKPKELLLFLLLRQEYHLLQIARFRATGEAHQWIYDSHSLGVLLSGVGFIELKDRTAASSYIENWKSFNLDTEADGTVIKPDSLWVEGKKPYE